MKYITIINPEVIEYYQDFKRIEKPSVDITDYPIAEPKLNSLTGKVEWSTKFKPPDNYIKNGKLSYWSIKKGETKKFPEYVAYVLLNRYPFLKKVEK